MENQERSTQDEFMLAVLPATVRLSIEIGEKRISFDENCPVLASLEKLIGIHPARADQHDRAQQEQAIHLAQLLRAGLEMADEMLQLDGQPAVSFAAGYLAGEISPAPLFSSDETRVAEDAAAVAAAAGVPVCSPAARLDAALRAKAFEAFRAGFTTRRDELRRAHQAA